MWLLGEKGEKAFARLDGGQHVFPGCFNQVVTMMEDPGSKVVVDCGPLGYGTIAAHGHPMLFPFGPVRWREFCRLGFSRIKKMVIGGHFSWHFCP